MILEGLYTATMGSFPLDDSVNNRTRVLEDLIALNIDFPNYPQLIDMGKQFLLDLEKGWSSPGIELFDWAVEYIKNRNLLNTVKLKACVTGVFTLASYIKIEKPRSSGVMPLSNTALTDISRLEKLTVALSETCKKIGRNASMVFIDEPILSFMVGKNRILYELDEETIVQIYNRLREACGETYVGTHICGRISPLLAKILLKTNLDILSHEFHDIPDNFHLYGKKNLIETCKTLAVGCLSTKNQNVESVEEISTYIEKYTKKYGKNMVFTPDCGFRNLIVNGSKEIGYDLAIQKLKNMCKALSIYNSVK